MIILFEIILEVMIMLKNGTIVCSCKQSDSLQTFSLLTQNISTLTLKYLIPWQLEAYF